MLASLQKRTTTFRFYTGTLAAGLSQNFECYGDYVFLLSNSGAANTLELSFGNTANQKTPVGLVLKSDDVFDRITIKNGDSGSTTFVVIIGQGYLDYKALTIGTAISITPDQTAVGTFAADVTTGAAAKVFTATTIKEVILQADFANSDQIYVGFDNTVSATKKVIALSPGMAYEFTNFDGDVWVFSTGAQKLSVSSW